MRLTLQQIQAFRESGNDGELGYGLLALAFLVKWVRSDTEKDPFQRAHELSLEALNIFRGTNDKRGQVKALISASSLAPPFGKKPFLDEAEALAKEIDDERLYASVMAARARSLGLSDQRTAIQLQQKALEIFRRVGDKQQQAQSLFSLAILSDVANKKRDMALEAAQINRDISAPSNASRCMFIAMMNAEEVTPLVELEELAKQGLDDAQRAADHDQESMWYGKLAQIAIAKGLPEDVKKYRRWESDLQASDGLTPLERWERDVESTKSFIALASTVGNTEMEKCFKSELKILRTNKPKR